jgi:hypothetical protein
MEIHALNAVDKTLSEASFGKRPFDLGTND